MLAFTFDIIAVVVSSWAERRQAQAKALPHDHFLA